MSDFSTTKYPKARKPHKCYECERVVVAGERYARLYCVTDGRPDVYDTCLDCDAWAESYFHAAWDADFVPDSNADIDRGQWELGQLWDAIGQFCREVLGYDS